MTYALASDVIQACGIGEITDLLRDELDLLTPELLQEALAGDFGDDRSEDERKQGQAAADRLLDAILEAARLMDGYFLSVEGLTLPLTQAQIEAAPVKSCCVELTRCHLKDDDDNMSEGAEKRCKRWFDWLRDVAAGRVKLVTEQARSIGVRSGALKSRYDWGSYGK